MSNTVKTILELIAFAVIILIFYNVAKTLVLSKIKANKWIVLISAILVFILSSVIPVLLKLQLQGTIFQIIFAAIFIFLFLWYLDLAGFNKKYENNNNTYSWNKKNKKNDIVIKPKAKPNRVKNLNRDNK